MFSQAVSPQAFARRRVMWRSLFKIIVLAGFCASLVNCAQRQLISQSSQFNRATAETASENILLNAARASKDLPLLFTSFAAYTAGNRTNLSASFSPSFPFGIDARAGSGQQVFNLNPNFNATYNPGVQSITLGSLNTSQGLAGIKSPLTFEEIQIYYESSASVPWQLLVALTTQVIQVTDQIATAVIDYSESFCATNERDKRCGFITRAAAKCGWAQPFRYQEEMFVRYLNSPLNECHDLQFQAFYLALTISGFSSENVTTTVGQTPDGRDIHKKESRAYFSVDSVQDIFKAQQILLKDVGVGPLEFKTRSPKGMIEYLGDIIKVENFRTDSYVPKILTAKGEVPIAIIVAGRLFGQTALRVKDDEGEIFSVPQTDYSASEDHLTLKTISIISDFYNSAIDKTALPEASTVLFTTR
jgi:hypothetical protein